MSSRARRAWRSLYKRLLRHLNGLAMTINMNILIPDSWLREYLKTKATPKQIKEYLSLCGPSVERIHETKGEPVYDIEITTNRPDAMSIAGVAREAAAILPRFGIQAKLIGDPYKFSFSKHRYDGPKKLSITTDAKLNPRFMAIVFENVKIGPSPAWLVKKLEQTGIRSINTVVDITNYLMHAYGQPAHVFDYDAISKQTMILRASKKGEKITTLDGKTHTLPGDDIVIEDGSGRLIDLCGIMGGQKSAVKETTTNVVLFLQTYDPVHIRKTSMALAHRTEAATLFEKGTDSELVMPVMIAGMKLMEQLAGGKTASKLYDIYPKPYKPMTVSCRREKIDAYLGRQLSEKIIKDILVSLGFATNITKAEVSVLVPSFRQDVAIDVDIIEEIARMYGYHTIATKLPDSEPPVVTPDPVLTWEEEIKIRLRDWGFTELYTYSMISEKLMDTFGLDKTKAYKIINPLSEEWVYMRPNLLPSILAIIEQNLHTQDTLALFELSMIYQYRHENLPEEIPMLVVAGTGRAFFAAKGVAQAIFDIFGIPFPKATKTTPSEFYDSYRFLALGEYGSVGEIRMDLLDRLGIKKPVTLLELDFSKLVSHAKKEKSYQPIPKYPELVEDLSFVVPPDTHVGPMMDMIKTVSYLIHNVTLLDVHENSRTFHMTYLDPKRNLTNEDILPIRKKITSLVEKKFSATIKGSA